MTSHVWRIAVETSDHPADDMSGTGAKLTGGRWNSEGKPVVYCATNIALAMLETIHTLRNGPVPYNRYLVRIDIPEKVWNARRILDPLPGGWDAIPAGVTASHAGDNWIDSHTSAILMVPSVIVPEEFNVLVNPDHPDAASVEAITLRRWTYDPRLFI